MFDQIASEQKTNQVICPVMNLLVDPEIAEQRGLVKEYKGIKYYFCCNHCPHQFEADPEKYI